MDEGTQKRMSLSKIPHILSSAPILIMLTTYIQDIINTSDSHSTQHEAMSFHVLNLHGSNWHMLRVYIYQV